MDRTMHHGDAAAGETAGLGIGGAWCLASRVGGPPTGSPAGSGSSD
jgi:hypothetical protein